METRISRLRASSISSRSDSEKRSISTSPRRGPSTPEKSPRQINGSEDERDISPVKKNSKAIAAEETSSPMMSDTEENQQQKRSHKHHRHHHHKQPKSNKRAAKHQKHSVKRR